MIKLASNAFLATKISFINEIANVCEEVGADVGEVARGMGLDERIGTSFLRAGIGYGGSCFPKDVSALKMLAGNTGYHFQLLTAVIEVNELQKRRVVGKLEKHLGSLIGKRVALLGLAFKPDTDDMREASSLVLAARLQGEGAEVVAYDPVAAERAAELLGSVEMATSAMEALEGADAAVLVTEWREFAELDWAAVAERMARPLLVDGRNFLDPEALVAAGLRVRGHRQAPSGSAPAAGAARPSASEMQAMVLVGGEGTRLRPLTSDVPKPALTLVDRPFLAYTIEWLAAHGVTEVVLACGFLPDVLREALRRGGARRGARSPTSPSPSRCGTAGAIRFAADALGERLEDRFLALNGDVLADLDLTRPAARPRGARRAGDDRPAPGRGLRRLRPRPLRRRRGRCSSSSRRPARRCRARSTPAPTCSSARSSTWSRPARDGLDRARGLPAAGRRRPLRPAARRLLDGHRHPRALPAGELGHPRGPGRDAGRADRAGPAGRRRRRDRPRAPRSGRARSSPPAAGSSAGRRGRATRSCSTAAASARTPASSGSILAPGVEVEPGAQLDERRRRPG